MARCDAEHSHAAQTELKRVAISDETLWCPISRRKMESALAAYITRERGACRLRSDLAWRAEVFGACAHCPHARTTRTPCVQHMRARADDSSDMHAGAEKPTHAHVT